MKSAGLVVVSLLVSSTVALTTIGGQDCDICYQLGSCFRCYLIGASGYGCTNTCGSTPTLAEVVARAMPTGLDEHGPHAAPTPAPYIVGGLYDEVALTSTNYYIVSSVGGYLQANGFLGEQVTAAKFETSPHGTLSVAEILVDDTRMIPNSPYHVSFDDTTGNEVARLVVSPTENTRIVVPFSLYGGVVESSLFPDSGGADWYACWSHCGKWSLWAVSKAFGENAEGLPDDCSPTTVQYVAA